MKEIICIVCPKGCHLQVDDKNEYNVTGNSCERGAEYGKNELLNPVRVVTSTVCVLDGDFRRASCKTSSAVPKAKVFEVMQEINKLKINAPVNIGDVLISNVANTGVSVVATSAAPVN